MDTRTFSAVFPRQLRFWSLHCLLNALPSLGIALGWLGLWRSPQAVVAMFSAIGTFVLLYATLTSLPGPLARQDHLLSRSLRLGAKIRGWISGVSLFALPMPALLMFTPDYWCGWAAILLVNLPGGTAREQPFFSTEGGTAGFAPVYLTTLTEGFILSFLLLMISFFALLAVQAKDRRRAFALTSADSPARLRR
jgi:hypothetical protein